MGMPRRWTRCLAPLGVALFGAGCDPVLNIYGSFFPAWVVSLAVGIVLTVALRLGLAAAKVESHLGPLVLVYPALAFLFTCSIWLAFFRS